MEVKHFWFQKDAQSVIVDPSISRKILAYHENMMMVEVTFKAGGIGQLHQHVHEQSTYVIAGKFQFEIDGVKQIIQTGDSVYINPNVLHGCLCLMDGILLDVFTPHRADFIK